MPTTTARHQRRPVPALLPPRDTGGRLRRRRRLADPHPHPGAVLRLAILIADAAGEILYWNAEAQQALGLLARSQPPGRLHEIFPADALERLRARRSWVVVRPAGAGDVAWRVRSRHFVDSGRSLLLFYPDSAAV